MSHPKMQRRTLASCILEVVVYAFAHILMIAVDVFTLMLRRRLASRDIFSQLMQPSGVETQVKELSFLSRVTPQAAEDNFWSRS